MKSTGNFNRLAKRGRVRVVLTTLVALLMVLGTYVFALSQLTSKYPTGYVIPAVDMGSSMLLEKGTVFGFNSAKSAADGDALATIQESACVAPVTFFDFAAGRAGWTTVGATSITYGYSGVEGRAPGALQTRLNNSTTARNYSWSKTFLWDCGTPSGAVPVSIWFRRGATWTNQGATCNLRVELVKPDASVVTLIPSTSILGTANSAWIELSAADASAHFNQVGVYTLRAAGTLQGASGSNLYLFLDDFNLGLTSDYASYSQDVEFTVRATPYSTVGANAYKLDIRAKKLAGDTETTDIQVWNGSAWTTRYSVTAAHTTLTTFDSYYLTTAEYNNGTVRVRYVDAQPNGDSSRGGIEVEYQRITVDQGVCVDQVTDQEADCGKCHNYYSDVSKPWPSAGMHNKHVQSESISDCLWCHPNNGLDSAHKNGALTIAGTKVYRAADGNLNGAPATATYDDVTKRCSNIDCHRNNLTPRWDATYGLTQGSLNDATGIIARNCSRCHNSGTAGLDTYSGPAGSYAPNSNDYNVNVAWPSTGDGGGHNSHNAAVAFDFYSCQGGAASCHPSNIGQHSVVGDGKVVVKMAPMYGSPNQVIKYIKDATNGTGTCANVSCHGGQLTPRFNLASTNPINLTATNGTACVKCHTPETATGWGEGGTNASQYNSPISGLHRGAPAVSGQDHSTTVTNGCQGCHTLASLTRHFQFGGVTNLDTPAMDSMQGAAFVASIGYLAGTGTSPNYTTPPTCGTTGTTTCHAENRTANRNPATQWRRKWSWDSYDTVDPVKPCNNCHGHWGTFSSGVVEPHVLSNSDTTLRNTLINNHSDQGENCATMCHGQGGSNYVHGVVVGGTTKDMSLNTNAGVVKTAGPPARVGCNMCHSATDGSTPDGGNGTNHVFAEANWVTDTLVTGSTTVSCFNAGASLNCHGNGTTEYWPNGTAYPDREGKHDEHMVKIAARLTITLPGTDAEQKRMCQYCHPASPGGAGHADQVSPADVNAFNPIWDATNPPSVSDAGSAYTAANGTCASIDCHNNKTTTAGTYGWRDAGSTACLMCHTVGDAGANPTTGLHNITAVGPQHHDDGITGGCTACHNATPPTTHINGTFTANSAANTVAERFINRTGMTYTETAVTLGRSGTCSGTAGLASCHSDGGNWARLWSTEADSTATATSSQRCNVCHGQWSSISNSSGWMAGTTHYKAGGTNASTNSRGSGHDTTTCDNCHVYGAAGAGRHNVLPRQINLNNNSATPARTGAVYGTDTAGCGVCHGSQADTAHNFPISYFPPAYVVGSAVTGPSCTGCHNAGSGGAPVVNSVTGSHVKADGVTFNACEDCHAGHADTTPAGPNVIYVPTTYSGGAVSTMNNAYASAPHNNRIRLGGTVQNGGAKSTEAEWCWGCHDTVAVSEWGINNNAKTGSLDYHYGDLYSDLSTVPGSKTSNWTTGFWRSGKGLASGSTLNPFWYKRGAIQSTHSVNFDSGTAALTTTGNSLGFGRTENKDEVGNIRCSWCHDVHGTHNGIKGDTSGGTGTADQPYLRGTWTGNQYPEDGAPQWGMLNNWTIQGTATTSTTFYNKVPRASAHAANSGLSGVAQAGAWWIDQNSNNPTGIVTTSTEAQRLAVANNTSGLCEQCHGTNKTGVWTTNSIGSINWSTNGVGEANNWISGFNGHANSVVGGPGRGANASAEARGRNILTRVARGTDRIVQGETSKGAVDMGVVTETGTRGYSYRSSTGSGTGYLWFPRTTNATATGTATSASTAYRTFAWGTAPGITPSTRGYTNAAGTVPLTFTTALIEATHDAQANYHTFTCAKCHNPHASRLPKLMITNCLDTNHNTWEDFNYTGAALPTIWTNTRHSQWASGINCHRLDARAALTTGQTVNLGRGWNRVTPWMEFTNPNSTRTANPNP